MTHHGPYVTSQADDFEDIPFDLSYEDMDDFARSCGVVFESDARDDSSMRMMSY